MSGSVRWCSSNLPCCRSAISREARIISGLRSSLPCQPQTKQSELTVKFRQPHRSQIFRSISRIGLGKGCPCCFASFDMTHLANVNQKFLRHPIILTYLLRRKLRFVYSLQNIFPPSTYRFRKQTSLPRIDGYAM